MASCGASYYAFCLCPICRADREELLSLAAGPLSGEVLKRIELVRARNGVTKHEQVYRDEVLRVYLSNPAVSPRRAAEWLHECPAAVLANPAVFLWTLEDPHWLRDNLSFLGGQMLLLGEIPDDWWPLLASYSQTQPPAPWIGWRWYSGLALYRRRAAIWNKRGMNSKRRAEGVYLFACLQQGRAAGLAGYPALPGMELAGLPSDSAARGVAHV